MAVAPEGTRAVAGNPLPGISDAAFIGDAGAARSVSVIVTTCSNQIMLERCLRSVLQSDYADFEVIVVDHGPPSPDTARMLVRQFPGEQRLRYLEEPWSSASIARNTGLARAEAESSRSSTTRQSSTSSGFVLAWMRCSATPISRA